MARTSINLTAKISVQKSANAIPDRMNFVLELFFIFLKSSVQKIVFTTAIIGAAAAAVKKIRET